MRRPRLTGRHWQLILTILSVFAGVPLGLSMRTMHPDHHLITFIGFPGEIFMNMLKMLILPLIAASLIAGLSQMDSRMSGRVGLVSCIYYCITMSCAVTTGILVALLIHPGDPKVKHEAFTRDVNHKNVSSIDKFLDLIRNMFPDNIVAASFQQVQSDYETKPVYYITSNFTGEVTKLKLVFTPGMNVLGIIVFCIAMGIVIGRLGAAGKPLADFFVALDKVITKLVNLIMWYAPIGIMSLIAEKILEIADLVGTAKMLGMYMLTVMVGLAIQLFVILPIVFFVATRHNPFTFLKAMSQAALTALGTASSAASLPVTFRCLDENTEVDPRITKFVLPVGAMINMDGTALYEAVAAIFIAQLNGVTLDFGQLLTVSDRMRTCVNVMGDACGCGFVHYLCLNHINEMPGDEKKEDGKKEMKNGGIPMDSVSGNYGSYRPHDPRISRMV